MQLRAILSTACLLTCACSSSPTEAEAAKARFALISKSGTLAEQCAAAKEVRDAFLRALDQKGYETWSAFADIDCTSAEMEGGFLPADNERRKALEDNAVPLDTNMPMNAGK